MITRITECKYTYCIAPSEVESVSGSQVVSDSVANNSHNDDVGNECSSGSQGSEGSNTKGKERWQSRRSIGTLAEHEQGDDKGNESQARS